MSQWPQAGLLLVQAARVMSSGEQVSAAQLVRSAFSMPARVQGSMQSRMPAPADRAAIEVTEAELQGRGLSSPLA